MKYLVRAIAATATLAALLFCNPVAAQGETSNNSKPTSTEAMLLAGTGIWSGGIDTSRPGCSRAHGCIKGAMTFQFFKFNGELRLRISFTPGDDAYQDAVERKSYAGSPDMKSDGKDAWRKPELVSGNKVIFSDNWSYECIMSSREAACSRVGLTWNTSDVRSHDGWVYKFQLHPWQSR